MLWTIEKKRVGDRSEEQPSNEPVVCGHSRLKAKEAGLVVVVVVAVVVVLCVCVRM